MAKVANQTTPAGAGATMASPRSESPDTDLTAIYAIVGEFVCGASQTAQTKECSKEGRAQCIMEITAEASERLDELEARISAHPNPHVESEKTARSGRPAADKTRAAHESCREHQAKLAAIRAAHHLLNHQFGAVQAKDRVGVRFMETLMGWVFAVGLFAWVYVMGLFSPNENQGTTRNDS